MDVYVDNSVHLLRLESENKNFTNKNEFALRKCFVQKRGVFFLLVNI